MNQSRKGKQYGVFMEGVKIAIKAAIQQSVLRNLLVSIFLYSFLHFCKDTWYYLTDLIVVLIYYIILEKFEDKFLIEYLNKNKIFVFVMSCSISFGLIGNYLLFFAKISLVYRIILFLISSILFIPMSVAILHILEKFNSAGWPKNSYFFMNVREKNVKQLSRKKIFIIVFGLVFLTEIVYLIAFYPGIVSYDVYGTLERITTGKEWSEYQSLFYYLCLKVLLGIISEVWFLVLIQIVYFTMVYSIIISWAIVCAKYLNWKILIGIAVFIAMLPNNASMIITLSKDVPFSISFMWLIYLLIRIKRDKDKILYIELVVASCGTVLFRQTGWVIVPVVAFICLSLYDHKKILAGVFACSFFIALITEYGIKMSYDYLPADPKWKYIAGCNDMIGIYLGGGANCLITQLIW